MGPEYDICMDDQGYILLGGDEPAFHPIVHFNISQYEPYRPLCGAEKAIRYIVYPEYYSTHKFFCKDCENHPDFAMYLLGEMG